MHDELNNLLPALEAIFEKYGVLKVMVFGSFARGEPSRRSDLDLLIIQDTDKRFLDRYDGILGDIAQSVPGRDVDVLIYTPAELLKMSGRPFIRSILKEGAVIYESERQPVSG